MSRAWLALQVAGVATPYHTHAFQKAAFGTLEGVTRPCVVTLQTTGGRTAMLLPLVIRRRMGVAVATFAAASTRITTCRFFDPAAIADLGADELRVALADAARSAE